MAECVVDFKSCLSEVLLKLNETGMAFSLKKEQESGMRHILNGKDVMTILPTGFGESLIFQLFVMMCGVRSAKKTARRNWLLQRHCYFSVAKHYSRSSG